MSDLDRFGPVTRRTTPDDVHALLERAEKAEAEVVALREALTTVNRSRNEWSELAQYKSQRAKAVEGQRDALLTALTAQQKRLVRAVAYLADLPADPSFSAGYAAVTEALHETRALIAEHGPASEQRNNQ